MARTEIKISNLTSLPTKVANKDMFAVVSNNKTYNITLSRLLEDVYVQVNGKEDYLGLPIRDGWVLSSDIQGNRTWILGGGSGVPVGGTTDQIIVKTSDIDGEVEWANQIIFKGTEIPDNNMGENGDTYIRYGMVEVPIIDGNNAGEDTDTQNPTGQFYNGSLNLYDGNGTDVNPIEIYNKIENVWIKQSHIPVGGSQGQALIKLSNSDGDIKWGDVILEQIVFKGVDVPLPEIGTVGDKYMQELNIDSLPPYSETATYFFETDNGIITFADQSSGEQSGAVIGDTQIISIELGGF